MYSDWLYRKVINQNQDVNKKKKRLQANRTRIGSMRWLNRENIAGHNKIWFCYYKEN